MGNFCMGLKLLLIIIIVVIETVCFSTEIEKRKTHSTSSNTYCDGTDWIPYKDEKCFKLITKWTTREEGKVLCRQESLETDSSTPQLVSIKSADEQEFLSNLIYETNAIEDNVWIGAKRLPGDVHQFVWDDESDIEFSDWAEGSPAENVAKGCVVMQSVLTKQNANIHNSNGKWRDVTCKQGNYVICEKLQRWSFEKLQKSLLEERETRTRKQEALSDSLKLVVEKLDETERQLSIVQTNFIQSKRNPVPIGFIYVQLPSQPDPKTLWPNVEWKNVTSEYAGLFFRAEGGGAGQFGTEQIANAPRVTNVRYRTAPRPPVGWEQTVLNVGDWSSGIGVYSGTNSGTPEGDHKTHQFFQSGGEVRPRNTAIRIWKRTN